VDLRSIGEAERGKTDRDGSGLLPLQDFALASFDEAFPAWRVVFLGMAAGAHHCALPTRKRECDFDHALLRAAHVPGPYVLVGHSFGGLLTRLTVGDRAPRDSRYILRPPPMPTLFAKSARREAVPIVFPVRLMALGELPYASSNAAAVA